MYFSKHNEKITYINHYSGLLEVEGEGLLCREDTGLRHESDKNWAKEYDTLSVTEGITGLGDGYIEFFSHIDCLILSRTVGTVAASPELLKSWRKRKVLICGEYETFAERFADENGLRFLHSDIHLADEDIEIAHELDIITLRFHENGSSDIHYNCFTPGSSAGSYGGGEYANPLPRDFYVGCTVEDFANKLNERVRGQILSNETLKRFLEISNERHRIKMTRKRMTKERRAEVNKVMKTKKKGSNWTAYYDEDNGRYFAEIMYTSREGREQYDYEITADIYSRLGTFADDIENERLIKTGEMTYSFENTMYGTLGPERTVWDEEANEAMKAAEAKQNKDGKKKK